LPFPFALVTLTPRFPKTASMVEQPFRPAV
jgi:hypothetical protein